MCVCIYACMYSVDKSELIVDVSGLGYRTSLQADMGAEAPHIVLSENYTRHCENYA